MANWIKVDIDTPMKDAIVEIEETCRVTKGVAFLAWFNLYAWFDSVTADGTINARPADIDQHAGLIGVADALSRAGWLAFSARRCIISNWAEHNGKSAKARAMSARRVASFRRRNANPLPPPTR